MRYQSVITFSLIILLIFGWIQPLFSNESEDALFSREEETFHQTELASLLEKLKNSPLEINSVSGKKLKILPWFSNDDVDKILKYRKNNVIKNRKSLQHIGLNEITIERIIPYISFKNKKSKIRFEEKFRVSYKEKTDEISSLKFYNSLKYFYDKYQFGFVNQKDAGEINPLDFYSYYLYYQSQESVFPKIIIGKYRLFFGQGICFAPKLGMSKSCEATSTPLKKGNSISPYNSTFEMWDLEGGAFILRYANFSLIPFYSLTGVDANLNNKEISSFDYSGYHKNLKKKNSVMEKNIGSIFNFHHEKYSVGFLINFEGFDHNFKNADFNKKNLYLSNSMNFNYKNYKFSSEISLANSQKAGIFVAKYSEEKYSNLILFRQYDRFFPSWHGHPFSAQSTNFGNEKGLYYGFSYFPNKIIKFDLYTDLWNFPNARYLEKLSTYGSEIYGKLTVLRKNELMDFTFQRKLREKKSTLDDISRIRDISRNLYRINFIRKIYKSFSWKNRIEYVSEEVSEEKKYHSGFLAYQQFVFKQNSNSFNFRITATHGTVLHYVYENNVSGIMQNRICRGDNLFAFIVIKSKISQFLFQVKVGGSLIDQSSLESYFFLKKVF